MRSRSWHAPLSAQLNELAREDLHPCRAVQFCQIELGLTLLAQVSPAEPARALWGLLSGYIVLDDPAQQAQVARARHVLPFSSRYVWEKALANYRKTPSAIRLYGLDEEDKFERREVSLCANRLARYQRVLAQPLPYAQREVRWAKAGHYNFVAEHQSHEVMLHEGLVQGKPKGHVLRRDTGKSPIAIVRKELIQTATWMDEQDAASNRDGRWEKRIRDVRWQIYDEDAKRFVSGEPLTLEGMRHVIGMVSSGKSTLMDVLAVHLAKREKHITIVLNDVVSVLNRVQLYERYGVNAAPILGKGGEARVGHNNRLHRTQSNLSLASRDSRACWVSPLCPLEALTNRREPLEVKDAPCQTLKKVESEPQDENKKAKRRKPKAHLCSLWSACPRFEADRQLVDASVWVATPASLIYVEVPKQQNVESLRYLELALRQSDLVIVDEADRVQGQLDAIFAPNQVIVDRVGRSLLGSLQAKINPQLDQKGRQQLESEEVESWVLLYNAAQTASIRLYALVQQKADDLKAYLGTTPFNGVMLSQRLLEAWANATENRDTLARHFEATINDPLGEANDNNLADIAKESLTFSSFAKTRGKLTAFIEAHTSLQAGALEEARIKLELFILTCLLTKHLEGLLSRWSHIEGVLDVENELSGRPPRDYTALVPTSPMGNVLALQFTQVDEGLGDLRYFRCAGVGRYILLNLHNLFVGDDFANPHVLLLSGTSWAGASPNYHVQVRVSGVLRAPEREVNAIARSRFEVTSLGGGPVKVSGRKGQARLDALSELVTRLFRRSDLSGRSLLDAHLAELAENRQRALLLTGSYEETEHVFREICRVRPDWQDKVRFLQADHDEKTILWYGDKSLRRGVVDTFAATGAKVLVAPLLAVERGHNILNNDDEKAAAIGAAYLLVRPHPRPNELDYPLHSINRWAIDELRKPIVGSLEQAARDKRHRAFKRWLGLLKTQLRYAHLIGDKKPDQDAVTWTSLVTLWQVIGRLVRGGQDAHVYFCDSEFAPLKAGSLDKEASLLLNMREVLRPYCDGDAEDAELVRALYGPLYNALINLKGIPHG